MRGRDSVLPPSGSRSLRRCRLALLGLGSALILAACLPPPVPATPTSYVATATPLPPTPTSFLATLTPAAGATEQAAITPAPSPTMGAPGAATPAGAPGS